MTTSSSTVASLDAQYEQSDGLERDEQGNPMAVEGQEDDEAQRSKYTSIISWVVSGALHATIILLTLTVVMLSREEEQEAPPVRITSIPPPPEKKEEKPKMEREILDPKIELDIDKKADVVAPITALDVPVDVVSKEEDNTDKPPKGREEAVADSEMGGSGAFMAIGAGGGSAGMFGSRTGGGRRRAVGAGGGSKGSESAVDAALRWFKKHQSPNGMWELDKYVQNCTEDPKCEPGTVEHTTKENIDTALTGYAVLAYLGAGFDHKSLNKYKTTVKKGLDWILSVQKPDGLIGERNYEHPVAAMALAEAYAMTNDSELRLPAQKAVDVIIARQNQQIGGDTEYAGLGWDYTKPTQRNDSSVTGWNIMALKSAYAGGLNIGNSMHGAKRWLEGAWKSANDGSDGRPDWKKLDPYIGISDFPYVWDGKDIQHTFKSTQLTRGLGRDCAPMGLVCAVFLGHKSGDVMLETLGNHVMKYQTPTAIPTNSYYLYYNSMGIFQLGGERWKTWNATVRDLLVNSQRKGNGCFDGSWDYTGKDFPGAGAGRVLATAYYCLSLEVYYRYAQVNGPQKR